MRARRCSRSCAGCHCIHARLQPARRTNWASARPSPSPQPSVITGEGQLPRPGAPARCAPGSPAPPPCGPCRHRGGGGGAGRAVVSRANSPVRDEAAASEAIMGDAPTGACVMSATRPLVVAACCALLLAQLSAPPHGNACQRTPRAAPPLQPLNTCAAAHIGGRPAAQLGGCAPVPLRVPLGQALCSLCGAPQFRRHLRREHKARAFHGSPLPHGSGLPLTHGSGKRLLDWPVGLLAYWLGAGWRSLAIAHSTTGGVYCSMAATLVQMPGARWLCCVTCTCTRASRGPSLLRPFALAAAPPCAAQRACPAAPAGPPNHRSATHARHETTAGRMRGARVEIVLVLRAGVLRAVG